SLRVTRLGRIEAAAPARVLVTGEIRLGTSVGIGPAPDGTPDDFVLQSMGSRVMFGRRASVVARLCAPLASLQIEDDAQLVGSFLANDIRPRRIAVTGAQSGPTPTPTSTTSTSTTSTTSRPPTTSTTSSTTTSSTPPTTAAPPTTTSSTTTSSTPTTSTTTSS